MIGHYESGTRNQVISKISVQPPASEATRDRRREAVNEYLQSLIMQMADNKTGCLGGDMLFADPFVFHSEVCEAGPVDYVRLSLG
jgi:hypothetical protein